MSEKTVVKEFTVKLSTLRGDDKDLMDVLEVLVPGAQDLDDAIYRILALHGIDHHVQIRVEEVQ